MNTEYEPHPAPGGPQLHPAMEAAMRAEQPRPAAAEIAATVEAERSMYAVQADPSLPNQTSTVSVGEAAARARGLDAGKTQVGWVRPTELAMRHGATASAWGVDLRAELSRRIREPHAGSRLTEEQQPRERSERSRKLPDLSRKAWRERAERRAPERAGIGAR